MKIVCSNCASRYSISDDKIRGRNKVFKIKCKNCGQVISIRGTEDGEAETAAGGTEEWYIAVGGERVGPLPLATVGERARGGEVTDQTFVWRQGFPDWKRAHEVPEIAALLPAAAAAAAAEQEMGFSGIFAMEEYASAKEASHAAVTSDQAEAAEDQEEAPQDRAAAGEDAGDDTGALAAAGAATTDEDEARPTARRGSDEGLFAAFDKGRSEPEEEEEEDQGVVSSTGEVEVSAATSGGEPGAGADPDDPNMVWQRHESSVLFSLDDYGSGGKKDEPAPAAAKESSDVTDSGLIDIRAIARKESATAGAAGDVFADFGGDDRRSRETFLPLDASAMPILRKRSKTPLYVGIAAGVLIAAAVAVWFLVFADKGTPEQPQPGPGPVAVSPPGPAAGATQPGAEQPGATQPGAAQPTDPKTSPAMAGAGPDAGATPGVAAAAGAPDAGATGGTQAVAPTTDAGATAGAATADAAAGAPGATVAAAEGDRTEKTTRRTTTKREDKREDKREAKDEPKPEPKVEAKAEPKTEPKKAEPKSADDLLKQLQAQKQGEEKGDDEGDGGGKKAVADPSLPSKLSASQLRTVVKDVEGRVKACAAGAESDAFIRTSITIANSGSVNAARVTSGATGGVASCVVGVLKSMKFPKFGDPTMTVNIPFKVK